MGSEKLPRLLAAEVAVEQLAFGAREVHDDQAVEGVGKFRVDVKSEEFSAQAEVLAKEDGDAGVVGFEVGDEGGELLDVLAESLGAGRRRGIAGRDEMLPGREGGAFLEEGDD